MSIPQTIPNPFRTTIVADPRHLAEVDVAEIHADVFTDCCRALDHVRDTGHSTSLLIHGEAGSGKTHLLARLWREAASRADSNRFSGSRSSDSSSNTEDLSSSGRPELHLDGPCLFVSVRLQTSPRMIWRHVRRRFLEDLLQAGPSGQPELLRVLIGRLAQLRPAEGDLSLWHEWMVEERPEELLSLVDQLGDLAELDGSLTTVLQHLLLNSEHREARRWLRGDSLPEAALDRLELSPFEDVDAEPEDSARRVVLGLCRAIGPATTIVVGFDQVEALQAQPGDVTGLFAFGQLISALHDETKNVLAVVCVQSAFATLLQDRARGSDYARMTDHGKRALASLRIEDAQRLIAARLQTCTDWPHAHAGFEAVPQPFWPLDTARIATFVGPHGCTPRRLLSWCAEHYDAWVEGRLTHALPLVEQVAPECPTEADELAPTLPLHQPAAVDSSSHLSADESWKDGLAALWDEYLGRALASSNPDQTEEILAHGLPQLIAMWAPDWRSVEDPLLADAQLIFERDESRCGLSFCLQQNMTSLSNRLRRLKDQLNQQRLDRLVLIRDSRLPISSGAKKTRAHLQELVEQGATLLEPAVDTLAALDTVRTLLSQAKSGDLTQHGQTISIDVTERWLRINMPAGLTTFVELLLTGRQSTTGATSGDTDWKQAAAA